MRKFGAKLLEVLRKGDMVLLALCVLTSVFGIVMVAASTAYDGSSRYVIIQTGALITGILLYSDLSSDKVHIIAGNLHNDNLAGMFHICLRLHAKSHVPDHFLTSVHPYLCK